jgi:hypothetical protein
LGSVAGYRRTGIVTSPKLNDPVQTALAMIRKPSGPPAELVGPTGPVIDA